MATSKNRGVSRIPASRSRAVARKRRAPAKAAAHRRPAARRSPVKTSRAHPDVSGAATAVLKSFIKLLTSLRSSAAHLSAAQRIKLQRAMKRAHAALG